MQKILDYDKNIIVSVVMTDLTQTSFSVNANEVLVTDAYIKMFISDNKKIVFIPWHRIMELTIEEV